MSLDITAIAQKLIDSLEGEQQKIKWITDGVVALHEAIVRRHEEIENGSKDIESGREEEAAAVSPQPEVQIDS